MAVPWSVWATSTSCPRFWRVSADRKGCTEGRRGGSFAQILGFLVELFLVGAHAVGAHVEIFEVCEVLNVRGLQGFLFCVTTSLPDHGDPPSQNSAANLQDLESEVFVQLLELHERRRSPECDRFSVAPCRTQKTSKNDAEGSLGCTWKTKENPFKRVSFGAKTPVEELSDLMETPKYSVMQVIRAHSGLRRKGTEKGLMRPGTENGPTHPHDLRFADRAEYVLPEHLVKEKESHWVCRSVDHRSHRSVSRWRSWSLGFTRQMLKKIGPVQDWCFMVVKFRGITG